jgi:hypothetical protein
MISSRTSFVGRASEAAGRTAGLTAPAVKASQRRPADDLPHLATEKHLPRKLALRSLIRFFPDLEVLLMSVAWAAIMTITLFIILR